MTLNADYWSHMSVRRDSRGIEYCSVPATNFLFGRNREHTSIPAAFCINRYTVTKAEFHQFLQATNHDYGPAYLRIMDTLAPFPNCPATPVSWWDAKLYARWLRGVTGEYYSLPSEWEWECAARGTSGALYPWGDTEPTPSHCAFSADEPRRQTSPVNAQTSGESTYGVQDMVGNVWEWCLDAFDEADETHVLKGGSCMDSVESCNCVSRRYVLGKHERVNYAGFRVIYLPGEMFPTYRIAMMGEESDITKTIVGQR